MFREIDGSPRIPQTVSQTWGRFATAANVRATLHILRHAHVSHLIAAGLDILTINQRIGHSSPTVTLNVHGHLMPQADDKAAAAIESALSTSSTEAERMDPLAGGNRLKRDF